MKFFLNLAEPHLQFATDFYTSPISKGYPVVRKHLIVRLNFYSLISSRTGNYNLEEYKVDKEI